MLRSLSVVVAGAALLALPAQAADLNWNTGAPAAAPFYSPTSAFNWSGFYAGVNGGYGWGTLTREPTGGGPTTEDNTGGWLVGGQAGYNMDMGGFIVGAEADLQWSNIAFDDDLGGGSTLEASVDGFGTVRARAGMAFDRVMPYLTGGIAAGRGTVKVTDAGGVATSQTNNHWGWTVGAGLEAALADNLTVKAEFLYVDLGSQTYNSVPGGVDATQRFSVVRAGLNYKF